MGIGAIQGIYDLQVGFVDENGYPIGQVTAPNAVTAGTTSSAYRLNFPVAFNLPEPTYERATSLGGQRIRGQRDLGASDYGEATLTLSDLDPTFEAFIAGSSVDTTTATTQVITAPNSQVQARPQMYAILSAGFTTATGVAKFVNYFLPNVQIRKGAEGASQDGGTNPNPLAYTMVVNRSVNTGFGFSYANSALNVTDDLDIYTRIEASKRLALTTHIDDGSQTSITLGFRPTSDAVDTTVNFFSRNGADDSASFTALNTTTGAATVTAGTSGDIIVVVYETDFVAI